MTDAKADALLHASKLVLERFESGYHPSPQQLERLRGAIEDCERMNICGHLVDECECNDAE